MSADERLMSPSASERPDVHVRFENVTKRFGRVVANREVSLEVRRGTVHAFLGENGAGKSTLMSIVGGVIAPDSGAVFVAGRAVQFRSPAEARKAGIAMVQQHLSIIPGLTSAENVFLVDDAAGFWFSNSTYSEHLRMSGGSIDGRIDFRRRAGELSFAERQILEFNRALHTKASLLILDEPTSSIGPHEGNRLLGEAARFASGGGTVLLVTHKLREVRQFADRVSVLRGGSHVGTYETRSMTDKELSDLMTHNASPSGISHPEQDENQTTRTIATLRLESASDQHGRTILHALEMDAVCGRVLGVAGVTSAGHERLADLLAGVSNEFVGSLDFFVSARPSIGYIPADRMRRASASALSVRDNLMLRDYRGAGFSRLGFLDGAALDSAAHRRVDDFGVKVSDATDELGTLSGGNVQRVVIARELSRRLDLLIAHNPTSGLDPDAQRFVRTQLALKAKSGTAVILISDDLDELFAIADELIVLYQGTIAAHLDRSKFEIGLIGQLMAGAGAADDAR